MEVFKSHLLKLVTIEEEEFQDIASFFQTIKVRKKENLLNEGQLCRYNYFVMTGCLRKYFINEKGTEQTIDFAIETWWATDTRAFDRQIKATINVQAVEQSTILRIDHTAWQQLLRKHPVMETYFRIVYQRAAAAAEHRIRLLYEHSREELFINFYNQYPEFVKRVPQYLLASFLGFTPEYLSEIKSKMRS